MVRPRAYILAIVATLVATMGVPAASLAGGDGATGGAAVRVEGRQVFLIISTDPSNEGGDPIVAFGLIHANGHDTTLGPRRDRFEFPDGNLIIRHRSVRTPVERFDAATCYFKFVEVGRWRVTRGTGDYTDAAGRGRYRLVGEGIGRKDAQGQCAENEPPREFHFKVRLVGRLSY